MLFLPSEAAVWSYASRALLPPMVSYVDYTRHMLAALDCEWQVRQTDRQTDTKPTHLLLPQNPTDLFAPLILRQVCTGVIATWISYLFRYVPRPGHLHRRPHGDGPYRQPG